jgi:GNAT superfamily N-acetyltransferase
VRGESPTAHSPFIAARTSEVRVPDGLLLRIRPIVPEDKEEMVRGYGRLSAESRFRRFLAPPGRLTPEMLAYLTEVDYHDHFALVAVAPEEPGEPGIAVARYVRLADDPECAEAAVTVLAAYQGRGVATVLMQALAMTAIENGIRRFSGYALDDNPILDMARAAGAAVVPDAPGVVRLVVDLPEQSEPFRGTRLYQLFRAMARGEVGLPAVERLRGRLRRRRH